MYAISALYPVEMYFYTYLFRPSSITGVRQCSSECNLILDIVVCRSNRDDDPGAGAGAGGVHPAEHDAGAARRGRTARVRAAPHPHAASQYQRRSVLLSTTEVLLVYLHIINAPLIRECYIVQ